MILAIDWALSTKGIQKNSVVTVPSNAEPPGANMLQNLLLLHIIYLLGALEALLPVSTLVEIIIDVNHCSINGWQLRSSFLGSIVHNV